MIYFFTGKNTSNTDTLKVKLIRKSCNQRNDEQDNTESSSSNSSTDTDDTEEHLWEILIKKINERTRSIAKPQLKRKLSKCQNVQKKWSEKEKGNPQKDQRHSVEDHRRHLVDEKEPSKDIKSPKRLFPEDLTYKIIHTRNRRYVEKDELEINNF